MTQHTMYERLMRIYSMLKSCGKSKQIRSRANTVGTNTTVEDKIAKLVAAAGEDEQMREVWDHEH